MSLLLWVFICIRPPPLHAHCTDHLFLPNLRVLHAGAAMDSRIHLAGSCMVLLPGSKGSLK